MNIFLLLKKKYDIQSYRYIHKFLHYTERKEYTRLKHTKDKYDQAEFAGLYNMLDPIKNIQRQIKQEDKRGFQSFNNYNGITIMLHKALEQCMKYKHYDIIKFLHRNNRFHRVYFFQKTCRSKNICLMKKFRTYKKVILQNSFIQSNNLILVKNQNINIHHSRDILETENYSLIKLMSKNTIVDYTSENYQIIKTFNSHEFCQMINKNKFINKYENIIKSMF